MSVSVSPLRCAACGAAIPLGREKYARCPFCNAETTVPAEYEALQRAALGFASDRTLAESLYGQLGKPPGRLARALAASAEGSVSIGAKVGIILLGLAIEQPLIGLAMFVAGAYALGWPVAELARAGNWVLGRPPLGPLSPFPILLVATFVVVFGIGIPTILLGKERKLAGVRKDVQASLAASLPERPGGPSRCRNCGAALDVPKDALGVPCAYCRADNLVALPADWVKRIQATEFKHFLSIDASLDVYRRAAGDAREKMWQLVFAVVLLLPIVMGIAWLLDAAHLPF